VWSSTFNTRSLISRARGSISLETSPIGVAVIQMIDARSAGVIFTIDPTKPDFTKMLIEANWGTGESVVSGRIIPDRWLVDRTTLEVVHGEICQKTMEYTWDSKSCDVAYVDIPSGKQNVACLSEDEITELAKVAKGIERHFAHPQDIEFAIKKELPPPDNITLLQTRPEKIISSIGIL